MMKTALDKKMGKREKVAFDKDVRQILSIRAQIAALEKEEKMMVKNLDNLYSLDDSQKEIIKGMECEMHKVPTDNSKLLVAKVKLLYPQAVKSVTTEVIDDKILAAAVAAKVITEAQVKACKTGDNWSHKNKFYDLAPVDKKPELKVVK